MDCEALMTPEQYRDLLDVDPPDDLDHRVMACIQQSSIYRMKTQTSSKLFPRIVHPLAMPCT
jgi:hypothetical protein